MRSQGLSRVAPDHDGHARRQCFRPLAAERWRLGTERSLDDLAEARGFPVCRPPGSASVTLHYAERAKGVKRKLEHEQDNRIAHEGRRVAASDSNGVRRILFR